MASTDFVVQVYGDIRTLYTAGKQHGFILVAFYDIRAAYMAITAVKHAQASQQSSLEITYAGAAESLIEKDINQGEDSSCYLLAQTHCRMVKPTRVASVDGISHNFLQQVDTVMEKFISEARVQVATDMIKRSS